MNANDNPKVLEIEVSNCDDYAVSAKLGEQSYSGNATSGKVKIEIADIPTEEKPLIIKLTAQGMKELTKTLTVKKDLSNTQPNEFKITYLELWGRDIKGKDSITLNANDSPKVLAIKASNCNDYTVSAKLGEQNYSGNATSGKVRIEIADIPTEETSLIIKLTAQGMKEFTKTLTVKKDASNTQLKEFEIKTFKLWGRDIKEVNSITLNASDSPKVLEIEASNCNDYAVSAKLGEQNYASNAASGIVLIPINDIPTEEKSLIIKLTAQGMKELTKTLTVKKDLSNTQPNEFKITYLELWGRDIKGKDSITLNANDSPKVLAIKASNCNDYTVSAKLGEQNYSGNATSGKVRIEIADIPTEETSLIIKLTAQGMKEFTKTLTVKKDASNTQLEELKIKRLRLWEHDIKDKDSVIVNANDSPKVLEIETSNGNLYEVSVKLGEQNYSGDTTSYKVRIEIPDIPTEETSLVIKLTPRGWKGFTKTLKVKKDASNTQLKDFNVASLTFWEKNIINATKTIVYTNFDKKLAVSVENCDEYLVSVNLNEKNYTKNATAGKAEIEITDVPMEERLLVIKLTAQGMKDFTKVVKVEKVLSKAYDLEVFFKTEDDNIEQEIPEKNIPEFSTTKEKGEVIIRTKRSLISRATINGEEATLSQDKKTATYNLDTSSNVDVNVNVEFVEREKASRTFKVKKYANQTEVPFNCFKAKIMTRDYSGEELNFDSGNKATIELNNIEYSCVKLVMEMTKKLESAELEECKDQRSANYSTAPTNDDYMGIYSGRLKGEEKNGVLEEFTTINEKTYTEYLIVGYGTVEYTFKLKSKTGDEKTYKVAITNKNTEKLSRNNFMFINGYGTPYYLNHSHYWTWATYSMLPINKEESLSKISDLEYMGNNVKMIFIKSNYQVEGDMYFYYNIYSDSSSKKHEFVRIKGRKINDPLYRTDARFDPKENFVDAFIGCKEFLPHGLIPNQTAKKWKKILNKGFTFYVINNLTYNVDGYNTDSSELFYKAFNYRVQAKTYEAKGTLNIGIEQEYEDLTGEKKSLKTTPFLSGMEGTDAQGNRREDIFVMVPTFSGTMDESIEAISYTIQKNKEGNEAEFEDVNGWTNVSLTPSKWKYFLVVNAKDEAMKGEKPDLFPQNAEKNIYTFLKGDAGNENIYKIIVKIKPKNAEEEVFNYKINYRGKESVSLMSLGSEPSKDASLFGLPISYQESLNREATALIKKAMAQDFLRQQLAR